MNNSAPIAEVKTYFAAASDAGTCIKRVANVSGQVSGAQATNKAVAGGEVPLGVLQAAVAVGGFGQVVTYGFAKGTAGAAITVGTHSLLTTDANGDLIPAANGELVWARFEGLNTAAAGDEIDIFVMTGQA